jgi:K+-transporting ATPase KdpF subunit
MTPVDFVVSLAAIGLAVYLVAALFWPEWFE